jgi:NAD(P)-dependent dehydrogenase (short-subunit alcohol dehydrogenase family)
MSGGLNGVYGYPGDRVGGLDIALDGVRAGPARGDGSVDGLRLNIKARPDARVFGYSATKGTIGNMTVAFAQLLAEKGLRVNSVLPRPIWRHFIVAGMELDDIKSFGSNTPYGRPGQPVEVVPPYVMLASDEASYRAISQALLSLWQAACRFFNSERQPFSSVSVSKVEAWHHERDARWATLSALVA